MKYVGSIIWIAGYSTLNACIPIVFQPNHDRGGKPIRVTSTSASRSSSVRTSESGSPPTSYASTIAGNLCRRIRIACIRTVNTFGIAIELPRTCGLNPSHTPSVFSDDPTVRKPPPLPPYR